MFHDDPDTSGIAFSSLATGRFWSDASGPRAPRVPATGYSSRS
jgi:hypothetical protein